MNVSLYVIHSSIPRELPDSVLGTIQLASLYTSDSNRQRSFREYVPPPRHQATGLVLFTSLTLGLPFSTRRTTQQHVLTMRSHV